MSAGPHDQERPLAFVIMPFDEEFKAVFDQLLVPPLEEAGFRVERADTSLDQENILKGIVRRIAESVVVVADLTARNPNVLYELGLAHGQGKPTVLVAQFLDDIPFDLRSYRVKEYSRDIARVEPFKEWLQEVGRKTLAGEIGFGNPISDFLPPAAPAPSAEAAGPYRYPEAETPAASMGELGETGVLDWRVDIEEGSQRAVGSLVNMQKAMEVMSERIGRRTQEMEAAKGAAGPGTASRLRAVVAAAAHDIIEFVHVAETELPSYRAAWERYAESTASLLSSPLAREPDQRESLSELHSSVSEALDSVDGATAGLNRLEGSVRGIRGISRDLNFAADRLVRTVRDIRTEFETSRASLTKILGLLDDILEGPQP
jgi:hypothetical protein